MKGIIWYLNRRRGEQQLSDICESYMLHCNIRPVKQLRNPMISAITFENGTIGSL